MRLTLLLILALLLVSTLAKRSKSKSKSGSKSGSGRGKKRAERMMAMLGVKMRALDTMVQPLMSGEDEVNYEEVEKHVQEVLDFLKAMNPEEMEMKGPLYNLYERATAERQESALGTCINDLGAKKFAHMKWMGIALAGGLKCKMQVFKDRPIMQNPSDCVKKMASEGVKMMVGKECMAKKMAHKMMEAGATATLICDTQPRNSLSMMDLFANMMQKKAERRGEEFDGVSDLPPNIAHMIKGPMCAVAFASQLLEEEDEKAICTCMQQEFADAGMAISKEDVQKKMEFMEKALAALTGAPGAPALSDLRDIMPQIMKDHDLMEATTCVLNHCGEDDFVALMKISGFMKFMKMMKVMKPMMKEKCIEKCECLKGEFPEAPLFAENPDFDCRSVVEEAMSDDPEVASRTCAPQVIKFLGRMYENLPDN